jgi:hypothetical protein
MKRIYFTLLFGLLLQGLHGQTLKAYLNAAENAYAQNNDYAAIVYFGYALEVDEDQPLVWYKLGESAFRLTALHLADSAFQQALDRSDSLSTSDARYKLAQVKKNLGDYTEAEVLFYEFASQIAGVNDSLAQRSVAQARECEWARGVLANASPDFEIISVDSLGVLINSPNSEFGARDHKDDLYFTTLRFVETADFHDPQRQYFQILRAEEDQAASLFLKINDDSLHTAHLAFNTTGTRVYYNLCEYTSVADIRCDLYYRDYFANDSLGAPVALPAPINLPGYTTTQPHVSFDPKSEREVLYFVSDRPGGKGQTDIWFAEILSDSTYSTPLNLSAVNTEGSEVTPFFHRATQTLYFATDGWKSLGGYDIYKAGFQNGIWSAPEHLPPPINSSFNEVSYWLNPTGSKGYLSSNRNGSIFFADTKEFCCYDIFQYERALSADLRTIVFDGDTRSPLPGATVQLLENGIPVASITNEEGNEFFFPIDRTKTYQVLVSRPGYEPQTLPIEFDPAQNKISITKEVFLQRFEIDLTTLVYDKTSEDPLKGVTVQLFDPERQIAIKTNNEDNKFEFPIDRRKEYTLVVGKPGYHPDTVKVIPGRPGAPDLTNIIQKVYLLKKELTEFVPLYLYFDNDHPDPDVRRTTTDKTYSDTYPAYYGKKNIFIEEYTKVLEGNDRFLAEQVIEAFFEREVRDGYQSLDLFSAELLNYLNKGATVEITITGFASPRSTAQYNLALGSRRIASLRNHFTSYQNGALQPFIQSGQLKIVEISKGDQEVPPEIIKQLGDERESIYSPLASRQRRVEIIGVTLEGER